MVKARMIVEGNVQGVAYRALVKQVARRMGIKGKVKNLDDGTVEIYCEADRVTIEKFKERITRKAKNPEDVFSLHVERFRLYYEGQEGYIPPAAELKAFEIDYGEEATSSFEKSNLERLEIGSLILSDFRGDSGDNFDSLGNRIDKFRGESNSNFKALDGKYHTVSKELRLINKNIAKLGGALIKLAGGYVKKKERKSRS